MRYERVREGRFRARRNRFVAHVEIDGAVEAVHVKNTGRLGELLVPGAAAYLAESDDPARKTRFDLIAVRHAQSGQLFNVDSQAPNAVVREWLAGMDFDLVKPEFRYGDSRVDFCMERASERFLLEIKGCTLVRDGVGYFPDAPTARGTKHLRELTAAARQGYRCAVGFVIQTEGVTRVKPNRETDPDFARALTEAAEAGVRVLHLPCVVEPDLLEIRPGVRFI